MRLASRDAEYFFKQSITEISNHLTKLFQNKDGKGISTIILVGGYAESPMLIEGIKSNFPEMRTLIPQEASSSILLGALIFGHNPSLIRQRRSKYTYGICVNKNSILPNTMKNIDMKKMENIDVGDILVN